MHHAAYVFTIWLETASTPLSLKRYSSEDQCMLIWIICVTTLKHCTS